MKIQFSKTRSQVCFTINELCAFNKGRCCPFPAVTFERRKKDGRSATKWWGRGPYWWPKIDYARFKRDPLWSCQHKPCWWSCRERPGSIRIQIILLLHCLYLSFITLNNSGDDRSHVHPKIQKSRATCFQKPERRLPLCQATQKKGRPSLRSSLNKFFFCLGGGSVVRYNTYY